jgi:hypothetical protein
MAKKAKQKPFASQLCDPDRLALRRIARKNGLRLFEALSLCIQNESKRNTKEP